MATLLTRLLIVSTFFIFVGQAKADIVIDEPNPGGLVSTFVTFWKMIAASGDKVVVDSECISACTYLLGIIDPSNVCLTERASFGIHQARLEGEDVGNPEITDRMETLYYPTWFRTWITQNIPNRSLDVVFVKPDVFVRAGYYKMCPPKDSDHPDKDWIDKLATMW